MPTTEITELSARTHSVSYQQVYSWVKKYDAYGLDGLLDGRGRHRDPARMDPLERAEYENKILQDKITRLETEVLALKKTARPRKEVGLTGVRHELEYIVVQDMAQLGPTHHLGLSGTFHQPLPLITIGAPPHPIRP